MTELLQIGVLPIVLTFFCLPAEQMDSGKDKACHL